MAIRTIFGDSYGGAAQMGQNYDRLGLESAQQAFQAAMAARNALASDDRAAAEWGREANRLVRDDDRLALNLAISERDRADRLSQTDWTNTYNTRQQGLDNRRLALETQRLNAPDPRIAQQQSEMLWKDALDQADQGLFLSYMDVEKAYPAFSAPQKSALVRQSLAARRNILAQGEDADAEAAGVARLMNKGAALKTDEQRMMEEAERAIATRWGDQRMTGAAGEAMAKRWGGYDDAKKAVMRTALGEIPSDAQVQAMKDFPDLKRTRDELRQIESGLEAINKFKPQALQELVRYEPSVSGFIPTRSRQSRGLSAEAPRVSSAPALVTVRLPTGQLGTIPSANLPAALARGAVLVQ